MRNSRPHCQLLEAVDYSSVQRCGRGCHSFGNLVQGLAALSIASLNPQLRGKQSAVGHQEGSHRGVGARGAA